MATLIGIEKGRQFAGAAGATRTRVSLAVSEDGAVATIGSRKIALSDDDVVFLHDGSSETFHGFFREEELRGKKRKDCAPIQDGEEPHRMVRLESYSGGADICAAVFRAPAGHPVAIITSRYRARGGWTVTVVEAGKPVERLDIDAYRARYALPTPL